MRLIIYTLLSCLTCFAQSRPTTPAELNVANLPAQPVGANDLLSVVVYDAPELSRTIRVSSDGYIKLPMLSTRLPVSGRLPIELEKQIVDALVSAKILVEPMVTVSVAEYHSRPINVIGAVKSPLTFQAAGPTTLLDALGKAGGLAENAASEILITSTARDDSQPSKLRRILIKDLLSGSKPELNLLLSGDEEISVPAAGRVFVMGNVKRPGAFSLHDASEGTVLQMLALSEGLTQFSTKDAYIYRLSQNRTRTEVAVRLDAILKRKSPDVAVLPEDILYVPENKGRRLGVAALERLLMFGSTAGATALIYSGGR